MRSHGHPVPGRFAYSCVVLGACIALVSCSSGGGGGGGGGGPAQPVTHSICGQVSGAAHAGVAVTLQGARSAGTTTDTSGAYCFAGLADGSYQVTPALSGFTFVPASLAINVSGRDVAGASFTSSAITYAISGTVSIAGGGGLAGAQVVLSGDAAFVTTTDSGGSYVFSGLSSGAYAVETTLPGWLVAPGRTPVTIASASTPGHDFTATPMSWSVRSQGFTLRGIASSGAGLAIVGDGVALASTDGTSWAESYGAQVPSGSRVIWAGDRFLATNGSSLSASTDGLTWTPSSNTGVAMVTFDVAYSGTITVAVGQYALGVSGIIARTEDGVTWTSQPTSQPLRAVTWTGAQFVAAGDFGTILTSPDGIAWTTRYSGTSLSLFSLVWAGTKLLASGYSGTILTSPDGITWTTHSTGTSSAIERVAWSGTTFVAVASPDGVSGDIVLSSSDGVVWTPRLSGSWLYDVVWSGTAFVAVGAFGTILTSPDGVTWFTELQGGWWLHGVTWTGSQFVAVGDVMCSGTCTNAIVQTSPDGLAWTRRESSSPDPLYAVAGSGSIVVAVGGTTGTSGVGLPTGRIVTSQDGVTWTPRTSGTTSQLLGVAWSGSRFVAVGGVAGVVATIVTSPDGMAWSPVAFGSSQRLASVAWCGTRFVAVGDTGTILTSPDGMTWTARASGTSQLLTGVTCSSTALVAVGYQTILSSGDGVTWATQVLPDPSVSLSGVTWTGSQFVAVGGWSGVQGKVLTSPDGTVWTAQPLPSTWPMASVTWSGTRLVAAGSSGWGGVIVSSP